MKSLKTDNSWRSLTVGGGRRGDTVAVGGRWGVESKFILSCIFKQENVTMFKI